MTTSKARWSMAFRASSPFSVAWTSIPDRSSRSVVDSRTDVSSSTISTRCITGPRPPAVSREMLVPSEHHTEQRCIASLLIGELCPARALDHRRIVGLDHREDACVQAWIGPTLDVLTVVRARPRRLDGATRFRAGQCGLVTALSRLGYHRATRVDRSTPDRFRDRFASAAASVSR